MRKLKAAVIGAGSTYTPELIEGFIERRESLNFQSFYLMDINREKLEIVGGLAKRMLDSKGFTGEFVLTQSLDEAVADADYIFAQIRVGCLPARVLDEKIPLKYGLLGQETTGAGGFMNALRTVPVLLQMAERIEKLAPNAWFLNFSNPSGIAADALLNHTKVKTIGLCNCPINMITGITQTIGHTNFDYDYVGLNHLSWITAVTVDGKNILDDIKNLSNTDNTQMKNVPKIDYPPDLVRAVPFIPSSYLSYFYMRDEQVKHCMEAEKTRGEVVQDVEAALLEKYKNPDLKEKPAELAQRGGALYSTAAVSVVDAIENDKNEYHVVNVKNNAALSFMRPDDVVEVKCLVNKGGATPVPVQNVDSPYITGLMRAVKDYEKLTVSSAMNGSREDALAALMVHPLIGDYQKASGVLNEMLEANKAYLSNFFR